MANELLDFVMSLVRDPDVAARYAADPAGTIADAHLANVTSVDVNNLIPVVSDSLSMAAPTFGAPGGVDTNVWTSGAATAAFDAFSPHLPDAGISVVHDIPESVIDTGLASDVATGLGVDDLDLANAVPVIDDPAQFNDVLNAPDNALGVDDPAGWDEPLHHAVAELPTEAGTDQSGFDLF